MLPAVIRTSFPVFCVVFRHWKGSCSPRTNKSPLLTLFIAVLVPPGHRSGSADQACSCTLKYIWRVLKQVRHSGGAAPLGTICTVWNAAGAPDQPLRYSAWSVMSGKAKREERRRVEFTPLGLGEGRSGSSAGPYGPSSLNSRSGHSRYPLLVVKP